ncbi:unnamed protein product, partial [Scytosiphon promiscuus]
SRDASYYYDESAAQVHMDPRIPLAEDINLAGENISAKRWTSAVKREIIESRVRLTEALCEALAAAPEKPAVLLSASAIGFYGDTGAEQVDEDSAAGYDFLARVAGAWEQATAPAVKAGIRTVHLRFGIVLSAEGGVLKEMLPPFRLGLGGAIGNGRQYMSWVSSADVVGIVQRCIENTDFSGPLNLVSNEEVDNAEFTRTLGTVLNRWSLSPFLKAPLVKFLFGEMGEALLLGSSRVKSSRIDNLGYALEHS